MAPLFSGSQLTLPALACRMGSRWGLHGGLALIFLARLAADPASLAQAGFWVATVVVLKALLSLFLVAEVLCRLTSGRLFLASVTACATLVLFAALERYQLISTAPLGYGLIKTYWRELFYAEGAQTVVSVSRQIFTPGFMTAAVVVCGVEGWWSLLAAGMARPSSVWWGLPAALAGYLVCLFLPLPNLDSFSSFAHGIYNVEVKLPRLVSRTPVTAFPYAATNRPAPPGPTGEVASRPNVILLIIESFNASFVGAKTPKGLAVTPRFNELANESVYVENFYGNGTATIDGQASILCSLWPPLQGTLAKDYGGTHVLGLPAVLRGQGYRTAYIQAYRDLDFAHTGSLMERAGFEWIKSMDDEFVKIGDEPYVWGWGLQDDVFYQKAFQFFDRLEAANPGRAPYFLTLATISTHYPFNLVPRELCHLFPEPANSREGYQNALHLADQHLLVFLRLLKERDYLRNTILVVVGDHGIPVGERGHFRVEAGAGEENFRTPLVIQWPGQLPPRRIVTGAYSQVDLAPTLLDLLGITCPHPFVGRSIFSRERREDETLMVQPGAGGYLVAVQRPWKYTRNLSTGQEQLFDLATDPRETRNMIGLGASARVKALRESAGKLLLNHNLILNNRIWPLNHAHN